MAEGTVVPSSGTARFFRWRWSLYASLFLGWCCYYFCRKTFPSCTPNLIAEDRLTKDDLGAISSSFAVAYGFSKFFNSLLSDHVSARRMFSAGLVLSGLGCLLFPVTVRSVPISASLWFAEGIIQGLGWAPCAKLLKVWYPPSQMGTWWSVLSSAGNVASGTSPLLITYISYTLSWRVGFYIVGTFTLLVGLVVVFTIKDSPSEVGVELVFEKTKSENTAKRKLTAVGSQSLKWYSVLLYGDLWVESGKPQATAAACIGTMQFGAVVGLLCTGYISDRVMTQRAMATKCPRAPVLLAVSLLMTFCLALFATTVSRNSSELWLSVLMFSLGFLTDGGVSMIGLISMEVVPPQMSGSAHGLACAMAQVGGFSAGWPFAHLIEQSGWTTAFHCLSLASAALVGVASYLLVLMLRGLRQIKTD
jgi:OPA family glycerol-6-phosphate transporter-like MFS transporter 4